MRAFLCSYDGFSLAIPSCAVSSIAITSEKFENEVQYNSENQNTYICLPRLFNSLSRETSHGIILKNGDGEDDASIIENRFILLTTDVECETELESDAIYPVPKTFSLFRFSFLFNGILFSKGAEKLILLLNPKQLIKFYSRS